MDISRSVNDTIRGRWKWEDLCGADGFKFWSSTTRDIGLCFEQLCLQIPTLAMLATVSAFYFGRQIHYVIRGKTQLLAIKIRCIIVSLMVALPVLQTYIDLNKSETQIERITYFLTTVDGIAWLTHLGFLLVLRKRLGLSPRGPLFMCVLWCLIAVLSVLSLRTHFLIYEVQDPKTFSASLAYSFSIVRLILQLLYGLTLIPGEGDTVYLTYTHDDETQALLTTSPYSRFVEERDPLYLGTAMEDDSWFSKLIFHWVNPLMRKGVDGRLHHPDDLYDLPDSLNTTTLGLKLEKALLGNIDDVQKRIAEHIHEPSSASLPTTSDVFYQGITRPNVSLLKALHRCFWIQFYGIGILRLIADCAGFAGPLLLKKLVSFIEDQSEEMYFGYLYALGLCLTTLLAAFCDTHFNFYMGVVGLKIRAALVTTIYRKTLTASGTDLNLSFSVGEIVNFMSTDTDRIVNSCPSFHAFWSIPFQLGVSLYLLYNEVGFAFLAGLVFSVLLIPINKMIANKIGQLSTKMMEQKDSRVKLMTEILRGIRTIKIHVWEQYFLNSITRMRNGELKYLKYRKYLDALCVYFWATTPVVISILTFGTYVLLGNKLTAATVFTSMALINMLIGPLNAFPFVLNGVTEAWVSIKRIQRFLNLHDLDVESYYTNAALLEHPNTSLILRNASFDWGKSLSAEERAALHHTPRRSVKDKGIGKKSARGEGSPQETSGVFKLNNISITIRKGEFVGIMGVVGSGKSSIFAAILAEISKQDGLIAAIDLDQGFGLVSQQPWLQRGTIRDNILFGKTFDREKYRNVIFACCLEEDFLLLPASDFTGVGEGGVTLSGGQKARIALARAIYQDKSIYLLDDVVSAVDAKVAKHIFKHCIMGLLKTKTRVLCTHHVKYLAQADSIIVMENGSIKQQGKPTDVLPNIDEFLPIDLELGNDSFQSDNSSSFVDSIDRETTNSEDSLLNEENREYGTVKVGVYMAYLSAMGSILSASIIFSLILMQTSRNVTDWWLSYWVSNDENSNHTNSTSFPTDRLVLSHPHLKLFSAEVDDYLIVYALLAIFNSFFTLLRAFLFAYGGIIAAKSIHKSLLQSVIWAKVTFFDVSPLGRIINRFSSDTFTVDDSLPFTVNILLAQFVGVIGSVILTIYGLPWLCLILIPLIPVYHWLQYYYRLTSRELKRLSSITLSPIYNHFTETLQGLVTIRALRATHRFRRDNEDNIEGNMKAQFASQVAAQWLSLRLQFIGVAMVSGVGFIGVIQHQFNVANPGLVGLAISYALSATSLLRGVINAFTETEREMIAVERVSQYIEEVEPETTTSIIDPPYAWPIQGVVSFNKVVLKYRDHLAPALKGVTFETRPAEKVGVVGRTGAGKSSLFVALFRLSELHSGAVTIDSTNISHIPISVLRSRLSCIPQEPFMFSGSLRENLDPLCNFPDSEIWAALSKVDLTRTVKRLGGLNYQVTSSGSNLSIGQRQLFCLARAVLHNTKILCVDEATANVDQATDRLIQQTLHTAFRKSTVIIIAHRIDTVLDCDRVLVMGDGQVLEFDSPNELLADPSTHFYKLVNQE
uniref:ABC-type xenobiotic transporter n=1 Tax=Photinus pyralis TaxID=7054 RepID=A0A1Y1JUE0_PHOPY